MRSIDAAQFANRQRSRDFDMIYTGWSQSLSPGNEQLLYWGAEAAANEGSRNWAGITSPAVASLVLTMLTSPSQEDYRAAVKALDRVLTSGRYVIPIWHSPIASKKIGFESVEERTGKFVELR